MIDSISQTILKKVKMVAKTEQKEGIAYKSQCPRCLKMQVKETLLKEGCYACGWKLRRKEE